MTAPKKKPMIVKDARGHMYKLDENGMRRISVEEGIEIEANLNPIPKPYFDFLKDVKDRNS